MIQLEIGEEKMKKTTTKTKSARKAKREEKRMLEEATSSEMEPKKAIILLVVIIVIFFGVYLTSAILKGEIKLWDTPRESTPAEIQYQEIIAGEIFNQQDEKYYVMLMDYTNDVTTLLMQASDNYTNSTGSENIYYVDLDKGFNKAYHNEEKSNKKATKLSELQVKSPTLLHIEKGKITKYLEGKDEIEKYLYGLVDTD